MLWISKYCRFDKIGQIVNKKQMPADLDGVFRKSILSWKFRDTFFCITGLKAETCVNTPKILKY